MATETVELAPGVRAVYGKNWQLMEDGRVMRLGEELATYDRDLGKLTWKDLETGTRYANAAMRLIHSAGEQPAEITYEGGSARVQGRTGGSVPPRPEPHKDWGEFTPSLVRWRHKFAPEEFQLIYGVPDMDETLRVEMPIRRKEVYPDYRSYWAEDQPEDREFTWKGEKYLFNRHKKGSPIAPHLWRAYGEEVVDTERKYPGSRDTVLTYIHAALGGGGEEQSRDVDPNIKY